MNILKIKPLFSCEKTKTKGYGIALFFSADICFLSVQFHKRELTLSLTY
jgi:hypothetical protein